MALDTRIMAEMELANQMEKLRGCLGLFRRNEQDKARQQLNNSAANDKFRKRKNWEASGGMLDYAVEIIHL